MIDRLVKDFDSLPKLYLIDCIQIEESQVCITQIPIKFVVL